MATHYDVIIIGSGAGGGTLARHLAPSGKRILLLERGGWLPREPENWDRRRGLHQQPLRLEGDLVRPGRQAVSAGRPLLRRRRHQDVRRRPLSAAPGRLRRGAPSRRHLAGVAHQLRRDGAVLHQGGAALPRPRRARRGPHRAAGERALSLSGGVPRAAHPAAPRRSRAGRLPAVSLAVRHHAGRGATCRSAAACAARTATASPASCTPSRDAEVLAVRPALQYPNVTLVTDTQVVKLDTNPAGTAVTEVVARHERRAGHLHRRHRGGVVRRRQLRQAPAPVGQRQASARARQRLGPGRAQLHVPQQRRPCSPSRASRTRRSTRRPSG